MRCSHPHALLPCPEYSHPSGLARTPFLRKLPDPRLPQVCVLTAFLTDAEPVILSTVVMIIVTNNDTNNNALRLLCSRDRAGSEDT